MEFQTCGDIGHFAPLSGSKLDSVNGTEKSRCAGISRQQFRACARNHNKLRARPIPRLDDASWHNTRTQSPHTRQ